MRGREARIKRRSLALVAGYASDDPHSALVRADQQDSLVRSSVVWLGSRLVTKGARERIERQSLYAGRNDPTAVEDVVVRKVDLPASAALSLGLLIGLLRGGPVVADRSRLRAAFAFFVPDLLIYNEGLKREEEMTKKLPDALDLLNLCVESGLSFQAALTQVATNQTGPVAEEFSVALQEMQLGRSRSQALEAMAGRTRAGGRPALRLGDDAGGQARRAGGRRPARAGSRDACQALRPRPRAGAEGPAEDPHAADAVLPARAVRHHPRAAAYSIFGSVFSQI